MRYLFILLVLLTNVECIAQSRVLVLDTYGWTGMKRIKIAPYSVLTYKLNNDKKKQSAVITGMNDSTIFLTDTTSILLKQIRVIYFDRSNFLTKLLSNFFRTAGYGFVAVDAFNNITSNESPVIKSQVVQVGAALYVTGLFIHLLEVKRFRPGKHKELKVLDLRAK